MTTRTIKAPPAYEDEYDDEESSNTGLISTAAHLALRPVRPFFSRPALRAYLTTIFAVLTAFTLLGLAIVAYILFYNLYIPRIGFTRPLHLQYDHILLRQQSPNHADISSLTPHPWATTTLSPDVSSSQQYDITLDITLPHTPSNREAGNFMLDVQLLASSSPLTTSTTSSNILAQSRLPALLPYQSRPVRLLQLLLALPQYTLGLRSESTTLSIPAFERVEFSKGWRTTPSTLRLEVQSIHVLQIEKVQVHFRARFRGLRWLMYNFRITSGIVFVGMFWGVECLFAGLAWGMVAFYFSSSSPAEEPKAELKEDLKKKGEIKEEEGREAVMSDTERTFPSRTGAGVVRYSSDSNVKKEIKEEEVDVLSIPEHVAKAAEADVEDEGEDSEGLDFRDSGIGTSLESEAALGRRDSLRRRQKRGRPESKD